VRARVSLGPARARRGGNLVGSGLLAGGAPQQAVVYKAAVQAVADGFVHERRRHRRVHSPRQRADGVLFIPNLPTPPLPPRSGVHADARAHAWNAAPSRPWARL